FALGFAVLVPAYWAVLYQSKRRVRAERRMTDLVENLPVTAWQLKTKRDSSRGFIYVGRSVERERGLAAEDVIGSTDAVLASIHEEDRPGVEAAMAEAERKLDGFDMRYRVRMPDGAVRWIHSHAALRREPDATILWSGYWVDITRQKELEFALREAKEAIESFSYSVSHDLRAPLAAIDGFSRVLAERHSAQLDGRGLHYVQRIRHNTTRMERMIDALLSLARATQGNRREQVDLSALAVELAADLREAEGARSVRFDVQGDFVAEGDPAQLRQLLANLLGNAWKFTGKHPEPLVSFGRLDGAPGTVPTFFVKDNGVGFDMAAADALFGAFQRLHDDAEFPGTGIGLATVRRIVECHGGRVWAESTPGEGATFYFTLGPVTR
ncbi:MAG TPA: ATP-binding protein, partial [Ramlibacter sp.]|nr:ATP-binding protein [Ramlibacter sp.]